MNDRILTNIGGWWWITGSGGEKTDNGGWKRPSPQQRDPDTKRGNHRLWNREQTPAKRGFRTRPINRTRNNRDPDGTFFSNYEWSNSGGIPRWDSGGMRTSSLGIINKWLWISHFSNIFRAGLHKGVLSFPSLQSFSDKLSQNVSPVQVATC